MLTEHINTLKHNIHFFHLTIICFEEKLFKDVFPKVILFNYKAKNQ